MNVTPGRPRLANRRSGLSNGIWALTLLTIQNFGMLLVSGMLMISLLVWKIILVSGLMGAESSISLVVLRLLVLVCTSLPLRRPFGMLFGVRLRSIVMPGWSVAVPLCR